MEEDSKTCRVASSKLLRKELRLEGSEFRGFWTKDNTELHETTPGHDMETGFVSGSMGMVRQESD